MKKLLARMAAAIFVGCVALFALVTWWRSGEVQWRLVLTVSILATAFFAVRAYFLLRAERRRRLEVAERENVYALGVAVGELIEMMARLSPGDLSVYPTALQATAEADTPSILTSQGSPNHLVLVQMTDLKLATPEEFRTFGEAPHAFTSVRYALTPRGRFMLPKLLGDVLRRRAALAGTGPSHSPS
jgi:hypothetical protein